MISVEDLKNKIGLQPKEARVYLALLKNGSGFASALAVSAGLKRSTTYQILENLHQKGLVLKYIKGKKNFYAPSEPQNILEYLSEQEKNIQKRKKEFENILPELKAFHDQSSKKPKLMFFDKKLDVENLILNSLEEKGENKVIGFVSLDIMQANLDKAFFKKYVVQVRKQMTQIRLINYDDDKNVKQKTGDWQIKHFHSLPQSLQPQIKAFNVSHDLTNIIFVTGAKTYLIDINPPDYMGTVIVNIDLAKSFKIMFESLWNKI